MSDVNFEGLLEMWRKKLSRNKEFLKLAALPEDGEKVLNLYLPKHCGAKHKGNNMISDEDLQKVVQSKPKAEAFLLYSCPNVTAGGIASALSVLNTITVLVLDELKLSKEMLMTIAEKVKTLHTISLFAFIGDVNDASIEAVARENTNLEWFILPGFSHEKEMKITSRAISGVVQHSHGLKKISMATQIFDDHAVASMIQHLQPDRFELLDVRKWGTENDVAGDLLKQLFERFPKLKVEEGSLLQLQPHILRKADVPLGFENIEIGNDKKGHAVPPEDFIQILHGPHVHMIKKVSISKKKDQILKALIDAGLHTQIKELDFDIGSNNAIPKSTQNLLAQFTSLETLDLAFHLGEASSSDSYVKTADIVKMLSKMQNLKKLDLSWCAITPKGVEKVVKGLPSLVELKMEGCGGETYDYTDFIMGIEKLPCLKRGGLKWSSRNKYGERSGMYQEEARRGLERLGMDTGRKSSGFFVCGYDSDDYVDSDDSMDSDEE